MEQRKAKWREGSAGPTSAVPISMHQLLSSRYGQLSRWGMVLTRGDAGKTEEIVQELCLYFTLSQPDLTAVANLDGYLYTSLRHIYLSSLARSSREALHFVSIAEFDSFDSALAANPSGDPLEKQNDLRRICAYTVWRKQSSKSASYFILHFFHGYARREIAELACLPIAAIYNKLKVARSEVVSYLEAPGKLRVVNRDVPPPPRLAWSLLSAAELFSELRKTVLQARLSDCLNEDELLAHYRGHAPKPISCLLLAHIVSCERCLTLIDRHFGRPTLKDREPLDCTDTSAEGSNGSASGTPSTSLKVQDEDSPVRRRWSKVYEHRPSTLSIARNGHILAFYDVIGAHSKLSARIDHPEHADFVEVFSEQDVRLALLSIGELPPGGAALRTQRIELSDDRWLELSLAFDGQGLNGQVAYFDPALAIVTMDESEEIPEWEAAALATTAPGRSRLDTMVAGWRWVLAAVTPSSAFAWALIVAIVLGSAGYLAFRHQGRSTVAMNILDESVRTEAEALRGQTEHQTLRVEELSSSGKVLQQGTVDLWKDGNGNRYLRRLYDTQHRLLAAEWRNKSGEHNSRRSPGSNGAGHSLVMSDFWDQDLSANAFRTLAGQNISMRAVKEGHQLTANSPLKGHPELISAALVLDGRLLPVRTILRVYAGSGVHELRFVQSSYERRPSPSVPDATFDPASYAGGHDVHSEIRPPNTSVTVEAAPLLADLQIAVLYQLNRLGVDTGEPIEVKRTKDGTIQVSGAIAGNTLKEKIVAQLHALPNHRFLDLKLFSSHELRLHPSHAASATRVYDIDPSQAPGDALLRKHFQAKGLSGEPLQAAVVTFSSEALEKGQRALQHAYALDRLGGALSAAELPSVDTSSQQQWTEMVDQHASDLEQQLMAIHSQLAELSPTAVTPWKEDAGTAPIENPLQFGQGANRLLLQVQQLNRRLSNIFASGISGEDQSAQDDSVDATLTLIPVQQARELKTFAGKLRSSGASAMVQRSNPQQERPDEQAAPAGPR